MDTDYKGRPIQVGDYARNIESRWLGKVLEFTTDHNGDRMAYMIGVDTLVVTVAGLSWDDALATNDHQWHAPADLIVVAR